MGWCYLEMGDLDNALSLFEQAEEASVRAGLKQDQVYWRNNIGLIHHSRREFEAAESAFQKALALAKALGDQPSIVDALNNLTLVALERDDLDLAQHYNNQAAALVHASQGGAGHLDFLQAAGLVATQKRDFTSAEELFQKVTLDPKVETSLKWQVQANLAEMYAAKGEPAAAEKEFRRALATFDGARKSIQHEEYRLSFLTTAMEFYDSYINFLVSHGRTRDALGVAEESRARTLAEGLGEVSQKTSETAGHLQPEQIARRFGATLLFYWLGRKNSYLWTITPSGVQFSKLPPAAQIDAQVKAYREALLSPRDVLETSNAAVAAWLYDTLVGPAKKLIAKNSRVIVLPDGSLNGLNLETLVAPEPQPHYWIEDVVVTNANSLTLLAASRKRPSAKEGKLLLVGDPVSPGPEFPDLSQAVTEMNRIVHYFPDSRREILSGGRATAAAYFASNPGQFSYIHFVAHGTASRAKPLESAVILTRVGDSYKLYARDIVEKHVNAELVTISACNGSGTRAYSGEGLVGLSWAFLRAGAHNVIGALWEVSDASTPQLMDDMYDEIRHGRDPATALRHAKLTLLHSDTPKKKPYYWAPFQLYAGS